MIEAKTKQKNCAHYWILESPDGRTSQGVCKYCGLVDQFTNDWHEALNNLGKKELPSSGQVAAAAHEPAEGGLIIDI